MGNNCGNIEDQLSSVTQLTVGSGGVAGPFRLELSSLSATNKALEAAADEITLESFDAAVHTWSSQNDPVMGGKSTSTFTINDGMGTKWNLRHRAVPESTRVHHSTNHRQHQVS